MPSKPEPRQNQIADEIWQVAKELGSGDKSRKLKELSTEVREQLIGDGHPKAIALFRCPRCHSVSMDPPEDLGGDGDLCPHLGGLVRREVIAYAPVKTMGYHEDIVSRK